MVHFIWRFGILTLLPGLLAATLAIVAATWLPARAEVVFVARASGQQQLMIADFNRGLRAALTNAGGAFSEPSISPRSREVVFSSRVGGDAELYALRPGEAQPRPLTDNAYDDAHPQWSPDGETILFQADPQGVVQFFLIDADGANRRQLTSNTTDYSRPAWSPDGSALVYDADGDIFSYDITSGTSRALTHDEYGPYDEYWDAQAVWSPDGGAIVYDSFREGSWNLYKLDIASSRVQALTPAGRDEQHATFTNEPGQIAYQSLTKFPGLLFLLDLSNPSDQRALTIPPDYGSPLHLLFGNRQVLKLDGIDILEPDWLRLSRR
jgi:Tol biopolymer transport system component